MTAVVAITGGIGSGKSTVARQFAKLGVPVIDSDQIAKSLLSPGNPFLEVFRAQYGPEFFDQEGNLDRRALRVHIFADEGERIRLNNLMHPKIVEEVKRRLDELTAPYCVVEIPLLSELEERTWIDHVVVIDANDDIRLQRVMQRDDVERDHARKSLTKQAGRQSLISLTDDIINNNGSIKDLTEQVNLLDREFRKRYQST